MKLLDLCIQASFISSSFFHPSVYLLSFAGVDCSSSCMFLLLFVPWSQQTLKASSKNKLWSTIFVCGSVLILTSYNYIPHSYKSYLCSLRFPSMSHCTKEENKIRCLIHYYERICRCMPTGFVSFERKVLPLEYNPHCVSYPKADYWAKSRTPLCSVEVTSKHS